MVPPRGRSFASNLSIAACPVPFFTFFFPPISNWFYCQDRRKKSVPSLLLPRVYLFSRSRISFLSFFYFLFFSTPVRPHENMDFFGRLQTSFFPTLRQRAGFEARRRLFVLFLFTGMIETFFLDSNILEAFGIFFPRFSRSVFLAHL